MHARERKHIVNCVNANCVCIIVSCEMSTFNRDLWITRAHNRIFGKKLVQNRTQKKYAVMHTDPDQDEKIVQYSREVAAIHGINKLVEWVAKKGIEVQFSKSSDGMYDPIRKQITISSRAMPETQLFFLMHECGHHLIGDRTRSERFGLGYSNCDQRKLECRVDVVDEECEAWWRGYRLAQKLKVTFSRDRFNQLRAQSLRSYFKWAVGA